MTGQRGDRLDFAEGVLVRVCVFDAVHGNAGDEHGGRAVGGHQAVEAVVRLGEKMDFFDLVLRRDQVTGVFVGADFGKLVEGKETAVWQSLGSRNDVDLTDLFVQVHRDNPDMTLTDLLTILEKLYRKHRVTIRIRTRG